MHELHSVALDFVCHYCDRQFYSLTVWAAIAHVTNTFINIVKFLLLLLSRWVCSHHIVGKQLNCRRISQNNTWKKSTQKALFLCSISVYFNMAYTIFASNLCLCLMWATLFWIFFFMDNNFALPNTMHECDKYIRLFPIHRSTHKSNYQ